MDPRDTPPEDSIPDLDFGMADNINEIAEMFSGQRQALINRGFEPPIAGWMVAMMLATSAAAGWEKVAHIFGDMPPAPPNPAGMTDEESGR